MKINNIEITEKTVIRSAMRNKYRMRRVLFLNQVIRRLDISKQEVLEMVKNGVLDVVVYDSGFVCVTLESVSRTEQDYQRMIRTHKKYQNILNHNKRHKS